MRVPVRLLPLVGWWCWCVGGVLPGALPLVVWSVGGVVCWFSCMCVPEGMLPLVVWWCWCGWCDAGGNAPLWFGGGVVLDMVAHNYS